MEKAIPLVTNAEAAAQIAPGLGYDTFKRLADASGQAIAVVGPDSRLVYANNSLRRLLGIDPAATPADYSVYAFFSDQDALRLREKILPVVDKYGEWTGEMELRALSGARYQTIQNISIIRDDAGKTTAIATVITDISARVRAEADLQIKQVAIESSITAIAIAGLDGLITYVNPAFVRLWRLSGPEQAIGHSPLEYGERAEDVQLIISALQQDGSWHGELRARRSDGELADVQLSAQLVKDSHGRPLCMMGSFVDVTERKKADRERARSAALLNSIFAHIPAMVFVKDWPDLRFSMFNREGEALLGFSKADLLGKNDFDFFPREQAEFFAAKDREVLASRQLKDIPEEPIRTSTGEIRYLHTRKIGIYDEAGAPAHLLGVSIDVTARKAMEEALVASEQRLKEAQRIAQVGGWELDLVGNKLTWSDEIFRLFEIDQAQFGATYEAFLNAVHPDDRERVNQAYTDSLANRAPYEIVHRLAMADGRIKWVHERCHSEFDDAGRPVRSVGTVQDVTRQRLAEAALRESDARYHSVVAALAEGIVLNGKDGAITASNEAAERILGLTTGQMQGRTPIDPRWRAVYEDGSPFPGEAHPGAVTLRTGLPQAGVIMGVHKPDGELTWISINSVPIFGSNDRLPTAVVASFVDITERKRTELALRASNEELEQRVENRTALLRVAKEEAERANRAKSEFLAHMSHELRTPLNAILGFGQLLEMGSLDSDQAEGVREIVRAGTHLLSLINGVLDLARAESGRFDVSIEPVIVSTLLAECVSMVSVVARATGVTIRIEPFVDCLAFADPLRLRQVLINLLSNAVKFNRDGGEVALSCELLPQRRVRISVWDNGRGIPAASMSRLFHAFERLESSYTGIEGSGIGLALSKHLVEAMGGSIGAQSAEGVGSTFWIEISGAPM